MALYHLLNDLDMELEYATYRDFPKNWTYYVTKNGSHRLWYVIQGEVLVKTENNGYKGEAGKLMLLPASDGLEFMNTGDGNLLMYSVIFKAQNRIGMDLHTLFEKRVLFSPLDGAWTMATLARLVQEFGESRVGYQLLLRALLYELLVMMLRCGHEPSDIPKEKTADDLTRLWPLIRHIEEASSEYPDTPEMARMLNVSEVHLRRLFKKYLSVSPSHFVVGIKMNQAKRMLQGTSLSIGEIAYRLGFQNQNYFTKVFRRYYGYTPRDCRGRNV